MIDFRNHKDLIRKTVSEISEADKNWNWSAKYIGKTKVNIRWGYLDYLEEKENCFHITGETLEDNSLLLTLRRPEGGSFDVVIVGNNIADHARTIEDGIKQAVKAIAAYAHYTY